ncbi:hypothetical protein [Actinoplanes xinjiangensis]|uniref:hypothetical protein n=1 Tax=Actinoplanes xinjiangensis TaxID=512350 RepID=UPI003442B84C
MTTPDDRMMQLAERVADALAEAGLVFIEDDKLDALALILRAFLIAADLPLDPEDSPM